MNFKKIFSGIMASAMALSACALVASADVSGSGAYLAFADGEWYAQYWGKMQTFLHQVQQQLTLREMDNTQ